MSMDETALSTYASAASSAQLATAYQGLFESNPPSLETWLSQNTHDHRVTVDLPEAYLTGIGQIVMYWALAEWLLAGTYCVLFGISRKEGRILLGNRLGDLPNRITQIIDVKNITTPESFKSIKTLFKECEGARNLIGHGVWMKDRETGELCIQDPAGDWKIKTETEKATVSKRKYPQAVYLDNEWFEKTLQDIKTLIGQIQQFDSYIEETLKVSNP